MTVPEKENKSKTQKNTCFARRHMKHGVHGFYLYAYTLSHGKNKSTGIFWSHARKHARELGVNKDTVTNWIRFLVEFGWLVCLDDGPRRRSKATGQMESVRYRVLDHDEWSALHPGKCFFAEAVPKIWKPPVRNTRTGDQELQHVTCPSFLVPPVRETTTEPVRKTRTKTVFEDSKIKTEPFLFAKSPNGGDAIETSSTSQIEMQLRDLAIPKLQSAFKGEQLAGKPIPLAPIFHLVAYHANELGMRFDQAMLDHAFAAAMDYCKIKPIPGSRELSALTERLAYIEKEIAAINSKLADPMCKDRLWTQSQRKRWTRERAKLRNDIEAYLAKHSHLRDAKEAAN